MVFQDAISIASLYLALVGLLSTFFFVQLGEWLNTILATEAKWLQMTGREPKSQFFDKRLECYYEAVQSSTIWTLLGWLGVTVFLIIVGVILEVLRSHLNKPDGQTIFSYVSIPSYIFLVIYLALSITMLFIGYRKATRVRENAKREL
jgi:hypothetical protein